MKESYPQWRISLPVGLVFLWCAWMITSCSPIHVVYYSSAFDKRYVEIENTVGETQDFFEIQKGMLLKYRISLTVQTTEFDIPGEFSLTTEKPNVSNTSSSPRAWGGVYSNGSFLFFIPTSPPTSTPSLSSLEYTTLMKGKITTNGITSFLVSFILIEDNINNVRKHLRPEYYEDDIKAFDKLIINSKETNEISFKEDTE